jgi:hypothetical protein
MTSASETQITLDIQRDIGNVIELALATHLRKRPIVHPPEGIVRLDRDTIEIGIARPALGYGVMQIFEVTVRLKRRVGDGYAAMTGGNNEQAST